MFQESWPQISHISVALVEKHTLHQYVISSETQKLNPFASELFARKETGFEAIQTSFGQCSDKKNPNCPKLHANEVQFKRNNNAFLPAVKMPPCGFLFVYFFFCPFISLRFLIPPTFLQDLSRLLSCRNKFGNNSLECGIANGMSIQIRQSVL